MYFGPVCAWFEVLRSWFFGARHLIMPRIKQPEPKPEWHRVQVNYRNHRLTVIIQQNGLPGPILLPKRIARRNVGELLLALETDKETIYALALDKLVEYTPALRELQKRQAASLQSTVTTDGAEGVAQIHRVANMGQPAEEKVVVDYWRGPFMVVFHDGQPPEILKQTAYGDDIIFWVAAKNVSDPQEVIRIAVEKLLGVRTYGIAPEVN